MAFGPVGEPRKRVDLTERSHGGVPPPHTVEYERHTASNGKVLVKKGDNVRPGTTDEFPSNFP